MLGGRTRWMCERQLVFSCFSRWEEQGFQQGTLSPLDLFSSSSPQSQKEAWPGPRAPGTGNLGHARLSPDSTNMLSPFCLDLQIVVLSWLFSAEIAWKMSSCGVFNINSKDATGIQILVSKMGHIGPRCSWELSQVLICLFTEVGSVIMAHDNLPRMTLGSLLLHGCISGLLSPKEIHSRLLGIVW